MAKAKVLSRFHAELRKNTDDVFSVYVCIMLDAVVAGTISPTLAVKRLSRFLGTPLASYVVNNREL
jgi:hypothetical protein